MAALDNTGIKTEIQDDNIQLNTINVMSSVFIFYFLFIYFCFVLFCFVYFILFFFIALVLSHKYYQIS